MIDSVFTPLGALAVTLAIVGGWTDVRARRIPNWLTVGAFVLAIAVRFAGFETANASGLATSGMAAAKVGLAGAGIAFAVGLVCHLLGMLGAGDVKYLAAFGAVLGAGQIWPALMLVALAGGVLTLMWAKASGELGRVVRETASLGVHVVTSGFRGSRRKLSDAGPDLGTTPIPFGVAIGAGCVLALLI